MQVLKEETSRAIPAKLRNGLASGDCMKTKRQSIFVAPFKAEMLWEGGM
jgi:hypothetical protein